MQNGASYHRDIIADIKASAKETALQVKGASATSLLAAARSQIRSAHVKENEGDLKGAFSSLTKSASLVQLLMDSPEFKAETLKKGALFKEFMDFQQVRSDHLACVLLPTHLLQTDGRDMVAKIKSVEAKLVELEKSASQYVSSAGPVGTLTHHLQISQE